MEAPFDFSIYDMPYLRRWWCRVLVENLKIEGHGKRFAHYTIEGRQMGEGRLVPVFRVPRKRHSNTEMHTLPAKRWKDHGEAPGILQLPEDILKRVLMLVVLQDGDPAILHLSVTCRLFHQIVSQKVFREEAHFSWLDSVVKWNTLSSSHRQEYRKMYTISTCRSLMCRELFKDCGAGYCGNGKQGVLWGFYSSNDYPGYCSFNCFLYDN
ncbi:hypothetical protein NL108_018273 [Boleophthalmus pectinirostris]|nr:hypothetical protein NL108_018273 [Boleophthalmus pectinirostris]